MSAGILDEMEWRGLIAQHTDQATLRAALDAGAVSVYAGIDPTAESLQVGNLVPLLLLRRFQQFGHRPIVVVGGATGLIGDPGGRTTERALQPADVIAEWTTRIRDQIDRLVDLDSAVVVNNYDWIAEMSTIDFLRDVGKHFTVNYMLAKESVSARLGGGADAGISFTEFSYMALQALDYLRLYERYGCTLQVGGSDQWGNITAGIELIRRAAGATVHALTFPLVTTASGEKFGKSAGNAVWLDASRTSPYAFYQYWLGADDRAVPAYLRTFTFLSRDELDDLDRQTAEAPQARAGQRVLAREMTRLVHGEAALASVLDASEALFGSGDVRSLPAEVLADALDGVPRLDLTDDLPPLAGLLRDLGLVASTSEARQRVSEGGVWVNGSRVADATWVPQPADLLHGRYLVVRVGKRRYGIVTAGDLTGR